MEVGSIGDWSGRAAIIAAAVAVHMIEHILMVSRPEGLRRGGGEHPVQPAGEPAPSGRHSSEA